VFANQWSGARVRERLVALFEMSPGLAVYSPTATALEPVDDGTPVDGLRLMMATFAALGGPKTPKARLLLAWARAHSAGQSTADFCRQMGTTRKLIYRSADDVAVWLNKRSATSDPSRSYEGRTAPAAAAEPLEDSPRRKTTQRASLSH
jgi:hypothetical protein